jgi:hypothetical protein
MISKKKTNIFQSREIPTHTHQNVPKRFQHVVATLRVKQNKFRYLENNSMMSIRWFNPRTVVNWPKHQMILKKMEMTKIFLRVCFTRNVHLTLRLCVRENVWETSSRHGDLDSTEEGPRGEREPVFSSSYSFLSLQLQLATTKNRSGGEKIWKFKKEI